MPNIIFTLFIFFIPSKSGVLSGGGPIPDGANNEEENSKINLNKIRELKLINLKFLFILSFYIKKYCLIYYSNYRENVSQAVQHPRDLHTPQTLHRLPFPPLSVPHIGYCVSVFDVIDCMIL